MSKKKTTSKNTPPPLNDNRSSEHVMQDLWRLLDQQNFSSPEDVNVFLQNLMTSTGGLIPEMLPQTPLQQAEDIIEKAWDNPSRVQRVKMAKKALQISADCADAYLVLAIDNTKTRVEARTLYEQAVAAAERTLQDTFEKLKGHFWSHIETRPYMRARLELAFCLWDMNEWQAAADHMAAMLELNPNDNQGVRTCYFTLLLLLEDDVRLEHLIAQYLGEPDIHWQYGKALYAFRKTGRNKNTDNLLKVALDCNTHVPLFLMGHKKMPKPQMIYISPGDVNEAADYVFSSLPLWNKIPGALDWLRDIVKDTNSPPATD